MLPGNCQKKPLAEVQVEGSCRWWRKDGGSCESSQAPVADEGHCLPLIFLRLPPPQEWLREENLPRVHLGLSSKSPWHGALLLSHPSLCLAPRPGGRGGGREEGWH